MCVAHYHISVKIRYIGFSGTTGQGCSTLR